MPSVSNAGGSLTSAIVLTVLAWGVRWIRSELMRRKKEESTRQQEEGSPGRYYAELSPAALRMLVETRPQPHVVFDVRPPTDLDPLPSELRGALRLPADAVAAALASYTAWLDMFQGVAYPEQHYSLVFVGSSEEQQLRAAAAAASQGFQRSLTLAGALPRFAAAASSQPHLHFVGRDALALMLGMGPEGMPVPQAVVIDVRRSDERALYGAIRGTVHVPVDQLPSALALPAQEFAELYRFPKPRPDELVIMSCRTNTRAAWAAALAQEAGLFHTAVYRGGVVGWRLDPSVKVYRGYKLLDPPPEPEPFQLDSVDVGAGASELEALRQVVAVLDEARGLAGMNRV